MSRHTFKEGEEVLIVTEDKKIFKVKLKEEGLFSSHQGVLPHNEIIGKESGSFFITSAGKKITVFLPTLFDHIMSMPRISAIVYPKDIAMILIWADIFPGARVLEGGSGSGSLLSAVIRAVGEKGEVYTYDVRKDMQKMAKRNLKRFFGEIPPNVHFVNGDLYEGIEQRELDRILLDVTEPWRVIPHATEALVSDGIILAYTPTIIQAEKFHKELSKWGYYFIETFETIFRPWTIQDLSIRPNQRIIGHTAFLTLGRKGKDTKNYEKKEKNTNN